ncbi:MAG: helix-turn-helix domain-containing protein [Armatimonadetes bacterium]|nr:helix-turn-helix domain-containing protein [Armatimonadota bacterium]
MAQRPVASLNTSDYDELISFIKRIRSEKGVSQEELSKRLGQSENFVLKIEHKDRRIDVVELLHLVEALGYRPDDAFGQLIKLLRS